MRILVLSQMYPRPDAPAFGAFVHRQTRALAQAGADVTVLAPMMRAPWPLWFSARWRRFARVPLGGECDGVRIYWPRYWSPPGMRWHFVEGLTMQRGVDRLARSLHAQRPFDLIHANRLFPEGAAAVPLARALGIPLVVMARGMDLNLIPGWGEAYRRQVREVAAAADCVLSVSGGLLADLAALGGRPRATGVVYNGCEVPPPVPGIRAAVRARLGLDDETLLVVYAGRLEPDKGTPELLRAFASVARRRRRLHLVAVGDVRDPGYREDIRRLGIASRAHFPGAQPFEAVQEYLQAGDIFLFPSRLEGVPNAVLEAMANGLPIVATRAGGIPEVVPPTAGLLSAVGDVRSLEMHLARLADDPGLRERMGRAGRQHVRSRFSWKANALDLMAAYERILAGRPVGLEGSVAA